jgi:hypothetical protein
MESEDKVEKDDNSSTKPNIDVKKKGLKWSS